MFKRAAAPATIFLCGALFSACTRHHPERTGRGRGSRPHTRPGGLALAGYNARCGRLPSEGAVTRGPDQPRRLAGRPARSRGPSFSLSDHWQRAS